MLIVLPLIFFQTINNTYGVNMDNDYYKRTDDLVHKGLDAISELIKDKAEKEKIRQSIFSELRKAGVTVMTRNDWGAKNAPGTDGGDWDYSAIVLHHAGNSFSCDDDETNKLRDLEKTDIKRYKHISYHYAIDCTGTIYETLDIREKGAHLKGANSGKIGIVFLSDFSYVGEGNIHGPSKYESLSEFGGQFKDSFDFTIDKPTRSQNKSIDVLVRVLLNFFDIKQLGGHREFAILNGFKRACPGVYGLNIANRLRREFNLLKPIN